MNSALSSQAIIARYAPAIFRYLRAVLGKDRADEVYESLVQRVGQGEWRLHDVESGRIRDVIRTAVDALLERMRCGRSESALESDRRFVTEWRASLLAKAWEALAEEERRSGKPLHMVLHYRAGHPEMRSAQMAVELSEKLGKALSADWVRKWLHAGREKFAELLLREVAASLRQPTVGALTEELMELELLQYCRIALELWKPR